MAPHTRKMLQDRIAEVRESLARLQAEPSSTHERDDEIRKLNITLQSLEDALLGRED